LILPIPVPALDRELIKLGNPNLTVMKMG